MKILFQIPFMFLDMVGLSSSPPVANKRLSVFADITGCKSGGTVSPTSLADSDSEIDLAEKALYEHNDSQHKDTIKDNENLISKTTLIS